MKVKSLVFLALVGDFILFALSYYGVVFIKFGFSRDFIGLNKGWIMYFVTVGIIALKLMITFDMYRNIFYRQKSDIILTITLVIVIGSTIMLVLSYLFNIYAFSRSTIGITGVLQIISLSTWRIIIWNIRKSNHVKQEIMIVGSLVEGKELAKKLLIHQGHLFNVKYIYDVEYGIAGILELITDIDQVLLGSQVNILLLKEISVHCMKYKKNIFMTPDIFSINVNQSTMIQLDDVPIFKLSRFGLSWEQKLGKRLFDLLSSSIGLIVSSPIMLLVALSIKLTSHGPIFLKQIRITEGNNEFKFFKFRTMVNNAEKLSGPVLASQKDPRITKVGSFLRATRLDELPQLFNVFLGHMSLIGPRPERPFFVNKFTQEVPEYAYRTTVKAGITGLAQVLGKYTTTYNNKLKYDLMYIKNYSFLGDLKILLKTIKVCLSKECSAGTKKAMDFEMVLKRFNMRMELTKYGIRMYKDINKLSQEAVNTGDMNVA